MTTSDLVTDRQVLRPPPPPPTGSISHVVLMFTLPRTTTTPSRSYGHTDLTSVTPSLTTLYSNLSVRPVPETYPSAPSTTRLLVGRRSVLNFGVLVSSSGTIPPLQVYTTEPLWSYVLISTVLLGPFLGLFLTSPILLRSSHTTGTPVNLSPRTRSCDKCTSRRP